MAKKCSIKSRNGEIEGPNPMEGYFTIMGAHYEKKHECIERD